MEKEANILIHSFVAQINGLTKDAATRSESDAPLKKAMGYTIQVPKVTERKMSGPKIFASKWWTDTLSRRQARL